MNSLRVPVEKELKQKVVFRIRRLNVQNGWAFLDGVPQQPGGKPVNYTVTRHQTAIEAGAFDDGILALLRTGKGEWRLVVYAIGSTDYPAEYWQQKYKAPPGIFRSAGMVTGEYREDASDVEKGDRGRTMRPFFAFVGMVACAISRGFSNAEEILTKEAHHD
jgi:hypothetical protein